MRKVVPFTQLLSAYREGDQEAFPKMMAALYDDMRRLAQWQLKGRGNATLSPTALVNEVFLKLVEKEGLAVENRVHFMSLASQVMRWVLLDYLKAKGRARRGGGKASVTLDEERHGEGGNLVDVMALASALEKLAKRNEVLCRVVELRCLVGLTIEETAEALSLSPMTVKRHWSAARGWLARELERKDAA